MLRKLSHLKVLALLAPLVGVLLIPAAAFGQEPQPAAEPGARGFIEFGVRQFWGDVYGRPDLPFQPALNTSKLNEYRNITNGFFVRRADVNLENTLPPGYFLHFQTESTLLKDQAFLVTFGRVGKYKVLFRWDQTPHIFTNTAQTLYRQTSPGVFTLPADIRSSLVTDPTSLPVLLEGVSPLDVSVRRKTATASATVNPTADWTAGFQFSREKQAGSRPISTYNPGLEFPEPIDYRTTRVQATTEYAKKRWGVQLGFLASIFENKVDTLVFDNAYSNTAQGRIDLYPDNTAHNLSFAGALDLTKSTRVMASIVPGWMRQNDAFLPFTINPAIPPPELPAQSLNGSKQTLAMNYTLVNHPAKHLELTARYRSYDYNNNTPSVLFPTYILLDILPGNLLPGASRRMPRQSLPYEFNRKNVELAANWEFLPKNSLKVGYEFERYDREHRDVRRSDENAFVTSLDLNPNKLMLARISYRHSGRSPDLYVENTDGFPRGVEESRRQLEGFRRFDEAARVRDRAQALVEFSPLDRLAFDATYGTTQDDFRESPYGLLKDISYYYTFDVDYSPRPEFSIFAEYAREKYNTRQRSRLFQGLPVVNNSPNNDWESSNRDLVDTWTAGVDVSLAKGRVTFTTYYSLSAASGSIQTWALGDSSLPGYLLDSTLAGCSFGGCTPQDFPDTNNRLHNVVASIKFPLFKSLSPKLEYRYEQYDRVDWQTQLMRPSMFGVDPDSLRQIFLGADAPSYGANVLAVTMEYHF